MMMSAEKKFTLTLIAIGAGTIAAKGLGAGALFETSRARLASIKYSNQIYSTFLSAKLLQL
jgi:hypothetical protein